jgi:type IV pilus assembly protein PilO
MRLKLPKINVRDPKVQRYAVFALVAIIVVVVWQQRVYRVKQTKLKSLQTTYEEKQRQLNAIRAMKPQLERLRREIVVERVALDSLKAMFPDQKEVPKLIQEITRQAQQTNIYTTKFSPLQDIQREYYVENHYSLSLWGNYHDFAAFLSHLANIKLIINLSKVEIKMHPELVSVSERRTGLATDVKYSTMATFEMTTFSSRK